MQLLCMQGPWQQFDPGLLSSALTSAAWLPRFCCAGNEIRMKALRVPFSEICCNENSGGLRFALFATTLRAPVITVCVQESKQLLFLQLELKHLSKAVQSFQHRVVCSFCIHWLVCMERC